MSGWRERMPKFLVWAPGEQCHLSFIRKVGDKASSHCKHVAFAIVSVRILQRNKIHWLERCHSRVIMGIGSYQPSWKLRTRHVLWPVSRRTRKTSGTMQSLSKDPKSRSPASRRGRMDARSQRKPEFFLLFCIF